MLAFSSCPRWLLMQGTYSNLHFQILKILAWVTNHYSSGILESSKCRISIRMEEKGGRNFRKLGFTDINLAEYAGAGPSTQRYILQPYDLSHRMDNSILQITLNITLKEGDTIFQRPLTRTQPILLPGEEEKRRNSALPNAAISTLAIPSSGTWYFRFSKKHPSIMCSKLDNFQLPVTTWKLIDKTLPFFFQTLFLWIIEKFQAISFFPYKILVFM